MTTAANVCPRCRSELRVYEDGDTDCPKCGWTPSPKASARAEPPPILASPFDAHVQAQQKLLEQLQTSVCTVQLGAAHWDWNRCMTAWPGPEANRRARIATSAIWL